MPSIPTLASYPVGDNKSRRVSQNIVMLPKLEPLQVRSKTKQYGRNGKPGRDLMSQIKGSGGGIQGHVITKAFSRDQTQDIAVSAGLTGALNGGAVKRGLGYRKKAAGLSDIAHKVGTGHEIGAQHLAAAQAFRRAGNKNLAMVGGLSAVGGGAVAGVHAIGNARRERATRSQFGKAALMSDAELRRRKRLQGNISIATSSIGLSALGAKGAGGMLRKVGRVKGAMRADHFANNALIGGAGLGGVGGFNFAATQKAEARKRNLGAPVKKAFDSERNRQNRMKRAERVSDVGGNTALAAAIGGGAALGGREAAVRHLDGKLKARTVIGATTAKIPVQRKVNGVYQQVIVERPIAAKRVGTLQGEKRAVVRGRLKKVSRLPGMTPKRGAALAGLAALGVGGKVASDRLESYRHGSGASHRPRYNSPR